MKLSEAREQVAVARSLRDDLHEEMHGIMADDSMPQGEAKQRVAEIRAKIKDINARLYPLEVLFGKAVKLAQGKPITKEEQELIDRCTKEVGEPISLG